MQKSENKIALIGGDQRQLFVAECFADKGYCVSVWGCDTYGIDSRIHTNESLSEAIEGADTIILPLPTSKDGMYLNCPGSVERVTFEEITERVKRSQNIVAGNVSPEMLLICSKKGLKIYDCMDSERFKILNAIPTAEGAVEIAMRELPFTVHGSKSLVVGFGRIGKALSKLLKAMDSDVYVSARKEADRAMAEMYGYVSIKPEEICKAAGDADVIFNTVPFKMLNKPIISNIRKGTPIIDLASLPGGVDMISAEECGIKVIHALSLPGKVAPKTAGRIMADCITDMLYANGVRTL